MLFLISTNFKSQWNAQTITYPKQYCQLFLINTIKVLLECQYLNFEIGHENAKKANYLSLFIPSSKACQTKLAHRALWQKVHHHQRVANA